MQRKPFQVADALADKKLVEQEWMRQKKKLTQVHELLKVENKAAATVDYEEHAQRLTTNQKYIDDLAVLRKVVLNDKRAAKRSGGFAQ